MLHRLSYQSLAFFIQNPVKEQYTKLMFSPLTGLTSPLSKKSIKRLKNDLLFFIIQTKTSRFTQHLNCLRFLHLSAAQAATQASLLDFLLLVQYYSFVISLKNYRPKSFLNVETRWFQIMRTEINIQLYTNNSLFFVCCHSKLSLSLLK